MWYFTNKPQIQLLQVFLLVFYPEKVELNFLPKPTDISSSQSSHFFSGVRQNLKLLTF